MKIKAIAAVIGILLVLCMAPAHAEDWPEWRGAGRLGVGTETGILARFSPEGYEEIGRTELIAPTDDPGNRRKLKTVNFSHPAYANRHVCARNDEEILCTSLAAE